MSDDAAAPAVISDEFAGRVVLVTGSSSGIGEQIAKRFSALGATLVVNSSTSVEAGQRVSDELPGESIYVQADISDPAQCQSLIDAVIAAYGRLDVLVNNAGWTARVDHRDLDAVTDEIFRTTFEVNVFGTWNLTKAAMPHLKRSDDGNIVTISSVAGVRPVGSSIPYAMSKAALNHMTVLLAKSHGPVRVNAVAPGLVVTPWTEEWKDLHEGISKRNPVPRIAVPDDCAEATLALVRNKYVSGEVFLVDGGFAQVV